jgi:hypothetical protein
LTGAPVTTFVVWMPVLATDVAPPTSSALARVPDVRASQYWDPEHRLSELFLAAARAHPEKLKPGEEIPYILWDVVLVFPLGLKWGDETPFPAYYGGPVVSAKDEAMEAVRRVLR